MLPISSLTGGGGLGLAGGAGGSAGPSTSGIRAQDNKVVTTISFGNGPSGNIVNMLAMADQIANNNSGVFAAGELGNVPISPKGYTPKREITTNEIILYGGIAAVITLMAIKFA